MKKQIIAYVLIASMITVILTGCFSGTVEPGEPEMNVFVGNEGLLSVLQVDAAPLISTEWRENDSQARIAARGANDFAFRLSAALAQNAGNESFVVSPYSVWLPLAALLNGTAEEHRNALLTALGASGITVEDINRAASRMMFDLTNEREREWGGENQLRIANAIFVDYNETLRCDFAQTFADYFRGSVMNVNFTEHAAVQAVNRWAYEQTDGLITDLIEQFNPDTVAAIANAIYFSDRWVDEFDPADTVDGVFNSPNGTVSANFMQLERDGSFYFEDENLQATHLSFANGGGMFILLPRNGDANELLADMTLERFDYIQNNAKFATVQLKLPRFSIESKFDDLSDTLTALGVPLFDRFAAPLTNGVIYNTLPTWLENAVQKTVIEVDERGTTAAAVTVTTMVALGLPTPTETFVMICDRPFAFILYGNTFDGGTQILFTGVVNEP